MDENQTQTESQSAGFNPMIIIALVAIIAIIGYMMFTRNSGAQTAEESTLSELSQITPNEAAQSDVVTAETSEVRTIEIEAGSFYFNPSEIRVKKGEKVKIVLSSVDMMHDFVIDEFDVRTPVTQAGESSTIEFTADQVGEFEYYCSVGQHRANGQVGTLIVEE